MFRAYRGVGKNMRGNGLVWGKKEEDAGQVWGVEAFEHDISPSIEVQELVHISGDLFHSITEITLETGFGMLATQDQSGGPRFRRFSSSTSHMSTLPSSASLSLNTRAIFGTMNSSTECLGKTSWDVVRSDSVRTLVTGY